MKGQGAMEYLMDYGWMLLIIVIVGAALFVLGVFNHDTYSDSRIAEYDSSYHCVINSYTTVKDYNLSNCYNETQYPDEDGAWFCLQQKTVCIARERGF